MSWWPVITSPKQPLWTTVILLINNSSGLNRYFQEITVSPGFVDPGWTQHRKRVKNQSQMVISSKLKNSGCISSVGPEENFTKPNLVLVAEVWEVKPTPVLLKFPNPPGFPGVRTPNDQTTWRPLAFSKTSRPAKLWRTTLELFLGGQGDLMPTSLLWLMATFLFCCWIFYVVFVLFWCMLVFWNKPAAVRWCNLKNFILVDVSLFCWSTSLRLWKILQARFVWGLFRSELERSTYWDEKRTGFLPCNFGGFIGNVWCDTWTWRF